MPARSYIFGTGQYDHGGQSNFTAPPRMAAYGFADVTGDKGTMTVFICNHCPMSKL